MEVELSIFFTEKKYKIHLHLLEPVISMSPEQISVIPNLSEIKCISLLPIRPIF